MANFKETLIGHIPESLAEQFRQRGFTLRFIGWSWFDLPVHEVRRVTQPQPVATH